MAVVLKATKIHYMPILKGNFIENVIFMVQLILYFGNAEVVFQDCNIYLQLPLHGQYNAIIAKGRTDPQQTTGTSIHHCNIRPAEDLDGTETYLGRTWKEYSRTILTCNFLWIA